MSWYPGTFGRAPRAYGLPPHSMPYLILSGQQVRDVSAYILSLRASPSQGGDDGYPAASAAFGLP
jgi:hypothetical protein